MASTAAKVLILLFSLLVEILTFAVLTSYIFPYDVFCFNNTSFLDKVAKHYWINYVWLVVYGLDFLSFGAALYGIRNNVELMSSTQLLIRVFSNIFIGVAILQLSEMIVELGLAFLILGTLVKAIEAYYSCRNLIDKNYFGDMEDRFYNISVVIVQNFTLTTLCWLICQVHLTIYATISIHKGNMAVATGLLIGLLFKQIIVYMSIDLSIPRKLTRYVFTPYAIMNLVIFSVFLNHVDKFTNFSWLSFAVYVVSIMICTVKLHFCRADFMIEEILNKIQESEKQMLEPKQEPKDSKKECCGQAVDSDQKCCEDHEKDYTRPPPIIIKKNHRDGAFVVTNEWDENHSVAKFIPNDDPNKVSLKD